MFLSTENEFGSDGLKAICEMFKGNKRIQEIQLWGKSSGIGLCIILHV